MDGQQTGRPVVVGVDGSRSALEAVRWAAREADRRQAPLRLVAAVGWTADLARSYGPRAAETVTPGAAGERLGGTLGGKIVIQSARLSGAPIACFFRNRQVSFYAES